MTAAVVDESSNVSTCPLSADYATQSDTTYQVAVTSTTPTLAFVPATTLPSRKRLNTSLMGEYICMCFQLYVAQQPEFIGAIF